MHSYLTTTVNVYIRERQTPCTMVVNHGDYKSSQTLAFIISVVILLNYDNRMWVVAVSIHFYNSMHIYVSYQLFSKDLCMLRSRSVIHTAVNTGLLHRVARWLHERQVLMLHSWQTSQVQQADRLEATLSRAIYLEKGACVFPQQSKN